MHIGNAASYIRKCEQTMNTIDDEIKFEICQKILDKI